MAGVRTVIGLLAWPAVLAASLVPRPAPGAPADGVVVLEARCVACHQPSRKRGGLDLTTREALLRGGGRGPAAVPGDAPASLLYRLATRAAEPAMPFKQERIPAEEADRLAAWIEAGAPYARPLAAPGAGLWSLRPLEPVSPPAVNDDWCRTPVDRFVLATLRAKGLAPSARADRRTLLRRATFDLTGLPPTPEEMDAFLKDGAPGAWERVVDRLLASPAYGERWGRHWLDVARYADSDGYELDGDRPGAYHYRDFVVRAFNDDLPFDTFVRWNLAGDELRPEDVRARVATGFCAAGPVVGFNAAVGPGTPMERERLRYDELDDVVSTAAQAFLGLTVGCARCHDHKFDPIPARDYYRLVAVFAPSKRSDTVLRSRAENERYEREVAALKRRREQAGQELAARVEAREAEVLDARIAALPITEDQKARLRKPATKFDPERVRLFKRFPGVLATSGADLREGLGPGELAEWEALHAADREAKAAPDPKPPAAALGLVDAGDRPAKSYLLARGRPDKKGEEVTAGFLSAVSAVPPERWTKKPRPPAPTTYRRAALAEWVTDVRDGAGRLTARVLVNRVWQHHFGEGLVRTPNDFGTQGEPPTHPELLDWLANELIADGWRLKPLHRLILTSAAYTQAGAATADRVRADPDGRLLSYRKPLRLEAEAVRDAILAVGGQLDRTMYGPAVKPSLPAGATVGTVAEAVPRPAEDGPDQWRRSVYLFVKRSRPAPLLQLLDAPSAGASCGRRDRSTVAPQALVFLNDAFVRRQAGLFADRVASEAGDRPEERVRRAYRLALGRPPGGDELAESVKFLRRGDAGRTLVNFCHVLLTLNEFLYVD